MSRITQILGRRSLAEPLTPHPKTVRVDNVTTMEVLNMYLVKLLPLEQCSPSLTQPQNHSHSQQSRNP
jgi:hypothetical protein